MGNGLIGTSHIIFPRVSITIECKQQKFMENFFTHNLAKRFQNSNSENTNALIIYLNELVMEISFDTFLIFLMEKKLILSSHIYSIEYLGLVLLLWSLLSNNNTCSTKKRPCWLSSYLATLITFFAIIILLFFLNMNIIALFKIT